MANTHVRLLFLGNWPITRRLTFGFLLAALIAGAAAGAAGLTHAQALGTEAQLYRQILNANQYLGVADYNLLLMDPTVHNALTYAQENDTNDLAIAKASLQAMEGQFTQALQRYGTEDLLNGQAQAQQVLAAAGESSLVGEQAQLLASVQRTWAFYQQAQDQVIALITGGEVNQAVDYEHRQGEPTHSDAISALNSLVQLNRQLAEAIQSGVSQQDQLGTLLSVLAAVVAVIAVLFVGWLISRSISRPLHQLYRLTQTVAQGRFNSRASPMTSDEIGSVTQAVNNMLDTIVGLLYETQDQRDTLTNHAEQLEGDVRGAAAGDLRVRAEVSGDAVGRLAHTFNLTLNRFRRFITGSQAAIKQMDTVARQIGERSSMLSRQARLEAVRFAHLGTVAEELAEQMRQAQAGANDAITYWQLAAEAVRVSQAASRRISEQAQSTQRLHQSHQPAVTTLAQRAQNLKEAVDVAEEVARRAVRMVLTTEVQIGKIIERVPGFQMIAEELRSLSEYATQAAHQMAEVIGEAQAAIQDVAAAITASSQERLEIIAWSVESAQQIDKTLQALEGTLAEQAQRLNIVRAVIAHTQIAEEISRAARESGGFLHATGVEAQKIAQAAEQLLQFDQRLLASLTPFRLPEPSGPLLIKKGRAASNNEGVMSAP